MTSADLIAFAWISHLLLELFPANLKKMYNGNLLLSQIH